MTMPTLCQTTPIFAQPSQCIQEFLNEKTNYIIYYYKSSGIDLAAIEPQFTHNHAGLIMRRMSVL
jgi:hypothetical protein